MPCQILLSHLVSLLAATPHAIAPDLLSQLAQGITTDTRAIEPGQVFLALQGERFDGHDFVEAAIRGGAIAAIVSHPVASQTGKPLPLIEVNDTLKAYQTLGRWWRDRFSIPVVAITGSVGKTTTKELVAAVLATQGQVLKTQANYNNEIGVPKTLLELDRHHDFAVIEMGMRAAGEIAELTAIANPDIAVITNVGTAHIGRLGSEQAIADAKCELLASLKPDGVAILNHDNARLINTAQRVWAGRTITYGLEGGDVQGHIALGDTLVVDGLRLPLPLPGAHNALNFLAALAVAQVLNLDWRSLANLSVELPQGRARRYTLPGDIELLDETYNAGLESMLAALRLLADTPGKRHIAVLGTMKELGARSPEFHHQVGQAVNTLGIDRLLVLADPAEEAALIDGAAPTPAESFKQHELLIARLHDLMQPGDRILFKASRAVGLDRVVAEIRQLPC